MRKLTLFFAFLLSVMGVTQTWAQKTILFEGFESSSLATNGWTTSNPGQSGISSNAKKTGSYGYRFYYYSSGGPRFLISPELSIPSNASSVSLSFSHKSYSTSYGDEKFKVGYSTTTNSTDAFTWSDEQIDNSTDWKDYSDNTLPKETKYIAIQYTSGNAYYLYIDDINITCEVSGPSLDVYDGASMISSGYHYNFGLTTTETIKTFTLKNTGTTAHNVSVKSVTGGYTAVLSNEGVLDAANGEVTLTIGMSSTSGDGVVTIHSDAESIDDFVFNVSGTVRDANKMWCNFSEGLPEGWNNSGGWTIVTTGADGITSGGGFARNTSYQVNKLIYSPLVKIAEGEKIYLAAKGNGSTASWNVLKIQYSADGITWNDAKDLTGITNTWQNIEVTEIPAGNWYIGFYGSYAYFTDVYGGTVSKAPVLNLSSNSYDFGLISECSTSSVITITNTGKSALTGMSVSSDNANFTVTVANDATEIAANGGTANFTVTMAPNATGYQTATITISSSNADPLTFTAVGAVAKTGVATETFDSGKPDTWTNSSSPAWSFSDGKAVAPSGSWGVYATLTTPIVSVAADDFLAIRIKANTDSYGHLKVFTSTDGTTFSSTALKEVSYSELSTDNYSTVIVTGLSSDIKAFKFEGYQVTIDEITGFTYAAVLYVTKDGNAVSTPDTYDFGECGTDATVTYSFANAGAGTINITNVAIIGDGAAAYSTNWTTTTAAPFDLVITRTYDASRAGAAQVALVTVTTSEDEFVINVTGTDRAANAPELAVDVTSLDFGKLEATDAKTVTVTNNGTGSMEVSIASDNALFSVSPASLTEIGVGESKTFTVTFEYNNVNGNYGVKNANITVTPTYDTTAAVTIIATAKAKDPDVWTEDFSGVGNPAGWDAGSHWTIADGVAKGVWNSSKSYLTTPTLTVSDATDELTFDYTTTAGNVTISVEKSNNSGSTWETCTISPTLNGLSSGVSGTATITGLSAGDYQFRFKNDDYNLDNFEGFKLNLADHICVISESTIPSSTSFSPAMKEGQSFHATVTVKENRGIAENLTAKLYAGTEVLGTATGSVAANGTTVLTINCTPTSTTTGSVMMHIEVEYAGGTLTTPNLSRYVAPITYLTLDQTSSDDITAGTYDYVTLKRPFLANWNTVCLPFTISDVEEFFGVGASAYDFSSYDNGTVNFSKVTTLTASFPYIVYVPAAISDDIELTNITIGSSDLEGWYNNHNGVYFRGTYVPIAAGGWKKYNNDDTRVIYILNNAEGKLSKAGANASLKGFRAYFDVPAADAARLSISFNDVATGIGYIMPNGEIEVGSMYNMQGQKVKNAGKGIYIINGKKVVMK